jgi:quercetin dioxygenase-like cupin family protein
MATLQAKRFESPDEVRPFKADKGRVELVELAGNAVGRGTFEPGWRWSEHVKPIAGTHSCQVEHIGYVLDGRMRVVMDDGDELEVGPGDVFHMPPGHDAWIVGEKPCVLLDFGGLRGYATQTEGATSS